MLWFCSSLGGASTPPFIFKGGEVTRKVIELVNMIMIMTLSLFVYFTFFSIDIAIYVLGARHALL
jgi:hypothetical protein